MVNCHPIQRCAEYSHRTRNIWWLTNIPCKITNPHFQPARHPYEENARIDQTTEGIFLRITHDISPGCEILAWYADGSLSTFGMDISYSSVLSTSLPNGIPSPGEFRQAICFCRAASYSRALVLWSSFSGFFLFFFKVNSQECTNINKSS